MSEASSFTTVGVRTTAPGKDGCSTVRDSSTGSPTLVTSSSRSSTPSLTIAPVSSTPRAGSAVSLATAPAIPAATSSKLLCPWSVAMPSRGISRFCEVVHIWPL